MRMSMQESIPASSFKESRTLSFGEFFALLLQALASEGVRPCILRNYQEFPDKNIGNDIDFLIRSSELPLAMRALQSIQGIRIIGYSERYHVAMVFLEGVSPAPGLRTLQVDFIKNLTWKGLPFLETDVVLKSAIVRQARELEFFVPSPVHEAISSLFSSLLVGGWLKEKYFTQVQHTFVNARSEVIAALLPQFKSKVATELVDAVISGDRQTILGCIRNLRLALSQQSLLHRPVRSVLAIVRYAANVIAIRHSPKTLETVCVMVVGNPGKPTIVDNLLPLLKSSAAVVEKRHFKPRLFFARGSQEITPGADLRTQTPEGIFVSMAKVVAWMLDGWLSQFMRQKSLTLRICHYYSDGLLIDPQGSSHGGPVWFAKLVGKLLPSPDLLILLDTTSETMQAGKPKLLPTGTSRQIGAYRSFVKTRKRFVILDASKPAVSVTEEAYAAIIDMLTQRTDRQLKKLF